MAATIKITLPNKRQFLRKLGSTRRRLATLNSKMVFVSPEVWELVNFHLEEKVRENFTKNREALQSTLKDSTKRWKKWAAKHPEHLFSGPPPQSAKSEFIDEYGQLTGFFQEQLEGHYAIGSQGFFVREQFQLTKESIFYWGTAYGKFHNRYVKHILKPPNYDNQTLGSLEGSPFALISLRDVDVIAIYRLLMDNHVRPLVNRFKARAA